MTESLVEMKNISKNFGGLHALDNVNVNLNVGEVVGILGHNGAGKSTLVKILSGAIKSDSGEIYINGKKATINNTIDARDYGIETIYQELALCNNLSAPANLFMGREKHKLGFLDSKYMLNETKKILEDLSIKISSLTTNVDNLSGGQRQSIAIGRAVYFNANIIIMDEPTAALGLEESKLVFKLINQLRSNGIGIFYISHDIHDIYRVTDRISVLKGGKLVMTSKTENFTQDEIIEIIISGKTPKKINL